jgi:hypothetical protein
MAGCLDIAGGGAFSEHLLDGIAGDEVNQQKDSRDDEPDDWKSVKQAGEEATEHAV